MNIMKTAGYGSQYPRLPVKSRLHCRWWDIRRWRLSFTRHGNLFQGYFYPNGNFIHFIGPVTISRP